MSLNNFKFDLTRFAEEINEEDLMMEEPLGLIPDGKIRRFPIIWNGKGRYVPKSLKVINNITNEELSSSEISEEDNGLFFNFITTDPPSGKYTDYTVKYKVREEDYRFSTGLNDNTPGEEYFLFPNWKNALGCGDGFWVGKYLASRQDATSLDKGISSVPQSKKGVCSITDITFPEAENFIYNKGTNFHMMRNREWTNIAYWMDMFTLSVEGNMQMYKDQSEELDESIINILDPGNNNLSTLTGMGPISWRHNLREDGIADLVGNLWEMIDGIKIDWCDTEKTKTAIFTFNKYNNYPLVTNLTEETSLMMIPESADTIDFNIDQIYEGYENIEGMPINLTTSLYYAPKKDWDNPDTIVNMSAYANPLRPYNARRMGYMFLDKSVSMWYICFHDTMYTHAWSDGFRLCYTLT